MSSVWSEPEPGGMIDYTLGGFELNDIFKGSHKLEPAQREIAVEFIRRSQQIQLERLQCLADGALLAAEQVQDVRLDLLEKGPEVDTTSVIVDLVIGCVLDSSIPGRIMKHFASTTCKRLIARSAILKVDGKAVWAQTKEEYQFIKTFIGSKELYATITEEMSGDRYLKHAKAWRKLAELASNSDVQKDVVAAGKTVRNAGKTKFVTKDLVVNGDTPGVSLLGSIAEYVSTNRLLVQLQYQRMETFVRLGFMTGDEARQFLTLAEFEPLESPLKSIRDSAKLFFEAVIWASIFKFEDLWGRYSARDGLKGIDSRLVNYWLKRFGSDVTSWNNALGTQGRRAMKVNEIRQWNDLDRLQKQAELGRYFIQILRDLPQKLSDANALISDFNPGTEVKGRSS